MADNVTKKEHYVPQCYLRNFSIPGSQEKINVFDKKKGQTRVKQNILDNASERYFYDIDIDKILQEATPEKREKMLEQLGSKYEKYHEDKGQYLEKFFSEAIEGDYSNVLKKIIDNASRAMESSWYRKNCFCMNEAEKSLMSICLTMQFLRTRKTREMLQEGYLKLYETLSRKIYNLQCDNEEDKIKPGDVSFSIGKEAMKVEHARALLDVNAITELSIAFLNHVWVVFINKSEMPFWTSDSPIALQNDFGDAFRAGKGISSKGVEIYLPISSKVCLGLFDDETYGSVLKGVTSFQDRFYLLAPKELVKRCNMIQLKECYRCVYSNDDNFELAEEMLKENPGLMGDKEYFDVG